MLHVHVLTVLTIMLAGPAADETVSCDAPSERAVIATAHSEQSEATDQPRSDEQSLEALLEALEIAGKELESFSADVQYESYEDLLGRREIRTGNIVYRIDREQNTTSFAVLFDRLIVGDRMRTQQQHYVFTDRWLAEIDHEAKQFIKRELIPPGMRIDPLKLGEGPIPLPIGQPKDEVLARFEVTRLEVPEEGMLAGLENVDGLLLIPREDAPEADDYQRVELFYDRETRLPIGINTIERNDNRKTVRLRNAKLNPELSDEQKARLSIETPDPKEWSIDIRPYRG